MFKTGWLILLTVMFLGVAPETNTMPEAVALSDSTVKTEAFAEKNNTETIAEEISLEEAEKKELQVMTTEEIWTSVYRALRYETKINGQMIATMALAEVKSKDTELMANSTDHIVSYHGRRFAITDDDYQVLLHIVESEAPAEDIIGKILVANVVLNRLEIGFGGNNISDVVFAKGQFEPAGNGGIFRVKISDSTVEAVERAINGEDHSEGALYFMARNLASKRGIKWFDNNLKFLFKHGGHEFYAERD